MAMNDPQKIQAAVTSTKDRSAKSIRSSSVTMPTMTSMLSSHAPAKTRNQIVGSFMTKL